MVGKVRKVLTKEGEFYLNNLFCKGHKRKAYLFPLLETAKVYQCSIEFKFGKESQELIQGMSGKQSEQEGP